MTSTTTTRPFITTPEGPGRLELYRAGADETPVVIVEMPCAFCYKKGGHAGAALNIEDARRLAAEIVRLCDSTESLNRDAFGPVLSGLDLTLEELADDAGVDLDTATEADRFALSTEGGRRLAQRITENA